MTQPRIHVSPAAAEQTIPVPPLPRPALATAGARGTGRGLARLLVVLVVVLGFLAASFVARNSDLWLHLATGRLLAQGRYSFGTDPFAYTTENIYWANHAWLFDLALYGLYGLAGGVGLVVVKASLVAALAVLLLGVRRAGGPMWLSALCTALAVVAMSPRLLLQPVCVSYFLLGLTLWLLWKEPAQDQAKPTSTRPVAHWLLPVLFVLWVNVDEWFFLGPLVVALFWLGERLGGERRTPGWLVPVGVAVCLLNPHTYHAFALPAELSPAVWSSALSGDDRFGVAFASPWQVFMPSVKRLDAAYLAYLTLLALSVVSFAFRPRALLSWRPLVWLPFAALAAWQARLIPFFAVVAAPVTALNLQDFAGSFVHKQPRRANLAFNLLVSLSPCLLGLFILGLIGLTWLGWLAGIDRQARHVGWGVQADLSLQQAAETLSQWRAKGLLKDDERVFAFGPEMAAHAAWFGRGEKQFFDYRYPLFVPIAADYETVCRALQPELFTSRAPAKTAERSGANEWRQALRAQHVGIVVYHVPNQRGMSALLRRLTTDPKHWTLLSVAGNALIVGWNESRPEGGFAALAFDPERLAFGDADGRARHEAPAAPNLGPEQLPQGRDFLDRLDPRSPAPTAWESGAATAYLTCFSESELRNDSPQRQQFLNASMRAYAASLVGVAAQPFAIPQAAFQVASSRNLLFPPDDAPRFLVRDQLGPYFAHLADLSPALPLLAVRAARRAVAVNPADANAWLRLGQAYLALRDGTCEHSGTTQLPPLAHLRHVQIAAALEEAVRLNPDLEAAHHELAHLYGPRYYLDAALEHQREELRLIQQAGPRPGESAEQRANRLEFYETEANKGDEQIEQARAQLASAAGSLQGDRVAQAKMALRLGLARHAVEDVLMGTSADTLGLSGINLELELLLRLGRVDEVRGILADTGVRASKQGMRESEQPPPQRSDGRLLYPVPYRFPAYEWLRVLQSAAVGDYTQAIADLRAIRTELGVVADQVQQQVRGSTGYVWPYLPGLLSGRSPFLPLISALRLHRVMAERESLGLGVAVFRAQQADLCVMEGLLALEQGSPDAARAAFAEAQELGVPPPGSTLTYAGAPIAAYYLGKIKGREK